MRDKIVVTIEPTRPRDRLDIAEAFEQVLDFLRLMELSAGDDSDFHWELDKAATNSPFTVVAAAANRQVMAKRAETIPAAQAKVQSGLSELANGTLPQWMNKKQRMITRRIAKRYKAGIGRVALRTDEAASRQFLFNSTMAAKALATLEKIDGLDDLFVPAHKSYGEVEGALLEVGSYRGRPALWIKTHSYDTVRCLVDEKKLEGIGGAASLASIWKHQRVRILGSLWFREGGNLEQIVVDKLSLFPAPEIDVTSIIDPEFTGGLEPSAYLAHLHDGGNN